MAKSLHAKNKRANRKRQRLLTEPERNVALKERMIRMTAYEAEQTFNELKSKDEVNENQLTEDQKKVLTYAQQLHQADEQKRLLRERGNFFFVHPHAKESALSIVEKPESTPVYTHEVSLKKFADTKVDEKRVKKAVLLSKFSVNPKRISKKIRDKIRNEFKKL